MTRSKFCCLLPLLGLIAAFFSGCSTFENGVDDKVTVYSYPSGATVSVNGEDMGTTPTTLELGSLKAHQVTLSREGYEPFTEIVAPSRNEWGNSWIRFGLLDDAGFYNTLKPDSVLAKLRPTIVPKSRSTQPFDDLTAAVAEVDMMLESGVIDSTEHKYIITHLVNFYTGG